MTGPLLLPFGIDNVDESYMVLNAKFPESTTVAPLFAFVGHAYGSLVGFDMINFRIFALLSLDLSVVITSLYFYYRKHDLRMTLLLIGLGTMLPMLKKESPSAIYGWDSLAALMISVCAIVVVELLRNPRLSIVVLCGLVTSLTTLVRLPSGCIMLIPLAVILILPGCSLNDRLVYLGVFSLCFISVLLLGLMVMYGSINGYIQAYQAHQMGAHPIGVILFQQAIKLIDVAMIACLFFCTWCVFQNFRSWLVAILVGLFLVSGLCFNAIQLYEFSLEMIFLGMLVFVLVYIYINSDRKFSTAISLLAVAACGYATACGSNVGLVKYTTFSLYPLIFIFYRKRFDLAFGKVVGVLVIITIVFSVYKNSRETHFDAAVTQCKTKVDIPSLKGLKTSKQRAENLEYIWSQRLRLDPAQSAHIVVLGSSPHRYMIEYLFDAPNMALRNDWSAHNAFNNNLNLEFVRDTMSKYPDLLVIVINNASWPTSLVGRYVDSYLSLVSENDEFLIYR